MLIALRHAHEVAMQLKQQAGSTGKRDALSFSRPRMNWREIPARGGRKFAAAGPNWKIKMAVTALPVRVVASGGNPVVESTNSFGLRVTPVLSGGITVTIVAAGAQALPVIGSGVTPL
jgi:hypothetical protein